MRRTAAVLDLISFCQCPRGARGGWVRSIPSPPRVRQLIVSQSGGTLMALRKFIIERDIPKVGTFEREQLRGAAAKSNQVLTALAPDIQWVESYVADNKTFCVYLAKDEAVIRKHAEMSGFPATEITEVKRMIDPTTETG
jgi:hypothetical protein